MGKKNRQRKNNIFIAREGDREEIFLSFLQQLFDPKETITLKFPPEKGGNSNAILDRAFRADYYPSTYAWFDEDGCLDIEHKKMLEKHWKIKLPEEIPDKELQIYNKNNKKPIVIVSTPMSIEGIIIRLFGYKLPKLINPVKTNEDFKENKRRMKMALNGFMGKCSDMEFYQKNLTKELILKKAKEIEELKLLLSIFNAKI